MTTESHKYDKKSQIKIQSDKKKWQTTKMWKYKQMCQILQMSKSDNRHLQNLTKIDCGTKINKFNQISSDQNLMKS